MSVGVGRAKYAPPSLGPFKCANCEYFERPGRCREESVVKDAEDGYLVLKDGKAVVAPRSLGRHCRICMKARKERLKIA